ncbi:MAG: hypothetical protein K0Q73_4653, partial [Paenibacillus sp.]|nr:hypothetical protein [Paenibacillus sp.]
MLAGKYSFLEKLLAVVLGSLMLLFNDRNLNTRQPPHFSVPRMLSDVRNKRNRPYWAV